MGYEGYNQGVGDASLLLCQHPGRYLERTLVDKGPSFETVIITIVVSGFLHDFDIFGFVGVQAL
jgi:hypothetical protein